VFAHAANLVGKDFDREEVLYGDVISSNDHYLSEYQYTGDAIATCEPILAAACSVIEPFKVRVITKGESAPYHIAHKLQVYLTDRMKKVDGFKECFPALRDDLKNNLPMLNQKFGGYKYLLSGDYKGATDTLRRDISVYAIEQICQCVGGYYNEPDVKELMVKCLVEHTIKYCFRKTGEKKKIEWEVKQMRGQLMGSYLSFPILNIINLAINWFYLDPECDFMPYDLPIVVNGDDVLAASNSPFPKWESVISLVGFKKSLGKNYVDEKFFCINSEFYYRSNQDGMVTDADHHYTFLRSECVRTEQLFNTKWREFIDHRDDEKNTIKPKRLEGRGSVAPEGSYKIGPQMSGSCCEEFMRCSQDKTLAHDIFVHHNMKDLKDSRRPWYLPADLGGLGIPCLEDRRSEWEMDAKLCAYLLRRQAMGQSLDLKLMRNTIACTEKDRVGSELDMQYASELGWTKMVFIDPTEEQQIIHERRPQLPDVRYDLLSSYNLIPEEEEVKGTLRHDERVVRKLMGEASAQKNLHPVNLCERKIVSLWVPTMHSVEKKCKVVKRTDSDVHFCYTDTDLITCCDYLLGVVTNES